MRRPHCRSGFAPRARSIMPSTISPKVPTSAGPSRSRNAIRILVAVALTAVIVWRSDPSAVLAATSGCARAVAGCGGAAGAARPVVDGVPLDRAGSRLRKRRPGAAVLSASRLLRQHLRRHIPADQRRRRCGACVWPVPRTHVPRPVARVGADGSVARRAVAAARGARRADVRARFAARFGRARRHRDHGTWRVPSGAGAIYSERAAAVAARLLAAIPLERPAVSRRT